MQLNESGKFVVHLSVRAAVLFPRFFSYQIRRLVARRPIDGLMICASTFTSFACSFFQLPFLDKLDTARKKSAR